MNRVGLLNGKFAIQTRSGRGFWGSHDISGNDDHAPHIIDRKGKRISFWYHASELFNAGTGSFYSVLHNASYYTLGAQGYYSIGTNGSLAAVSASNMVLDRDIADPSRKSPTNPYAFAAPGGGTIWLPSDCAAILSAISQAYSVYNGHITYNHGNFFPLGWNQSSSSPAVASRSARRTI